MEGGMEGEYGEGGKEKGGEEGSKGREVKGEAEWIEGVMER